MLSYKSGTYDGNEVTNVKYGTEDSIEDVADWYESELGDATSREDEGDSIELSYMEVAGHDVFEEHDVETYLVIMISSNGYTTIEVQTATELG